MLLEHVADLLSRQGLTSTMISVRDFPAEDLLQAKWDSPSFGAAKKQVDEAAGVVISTPVYKAAYSGILKTFLDILPQSGFRGKTVLPIMSGGSPHHLLAIDFSLKPLLAAMGATDVLQGVYTVDTQFSKDATGRFTVAEEILKRLEEAVQHLATNVKAKLSA